MIYIIRAAGTSKYKIGFTDRAVEERMKELQTGSPDPLKIIHVFDGTFEDEKRLHLECDDFRIQGEWFDMNEDKLWAVFVNVLFAPRKPIQIVSDDALSQKTHFKDFLEKHLVFSRKKIKEINNGMTEDEVYEKYLEYCQRKQFKPLSKKYLLGKMNSQELALPKERFGDVWVFHARLNPNSFLDHSGVFDRGYKFDHDKKGKM